MNNNNNALPISNSNILILTYYIPNHANYALFPFLFLPLPTDLVLLSDFFALPPSISSFAGRLLGSFVTHSASFEPPNQLTSFDMVASHPKPSTLKSPCKGK